MPSVASVCTLSAFEVYLVDICKTKTYLDALIGETVIETPESACQRVPGLYIVLCDGYRSTKEHNSCNRK